MRVEQLTTAAEAEWEEFVAAHPAGLLYYSIRYRNLLVEHLRCEALYLVARDGDGIAGVLPVMRRGGVLNSLPYFGSHGAVLAGDTGAEAALLNAWDELAADSSIRAATMVSNPFAGPLSRVPSHTHSDRRISQVTTIPSTADELMSMVDASARRNVRKAERLGVEVATDDRAIDELCAIHRQNIEALGGVAKEASFFEAVGRHFTAGEHYDVWVARFRGDVVAGLLVFYYGGTAEYFTPAVHHEHRSAQPLAPILVAAMARAAEKGMARWNWGGTWTTQDGVYRFKRKWGAEAGAYEYWSRVNDEALLSAPASELVSDFRHFYVVPFSALRATRGSA